MAQILVGHDVTGGIRKFDRDGDLTAGQKLSQCFFLSFSRLLNKDEIKKEAFQSHSLQAAYLKISVLVKPTMAILS